MSASQNLNILSLGENTWLKKLAITLKNFPIFIPFFLCTTAATPADTNLHRSELSSLVGEKAITSVFTDDNGYLWIGTQRGLYFLDGAQVKTYSAKRAQEQRIPVSDIRDITATQEGRILLATYGGGLAISNFELSFFESIKNSSYEYTDYLRQIVRDESGNFWLASDSDLFLFDSQSKKLKQVKELYPELSELSGPWLISNGPKGGIYLSADSDVYKVSPGAGRLEPALKLRSRGHISAMFVRKDTILVGTDKGHLVQVQMDSGEATASTKLDSGHPLTVTAILEYQNKLWVGTNRGLFELLPNLNTIQVLRRKNSLIPNDHITLLHILNDELLIGTYSGLVHATPAHFKLFNLSNSGIYNDIMCFEEDADGTLWVGTFDGLYKYDEGKAKHVRLASINGQNLPDQRAMTIEAVENIIWIGLWDDGVVLLDRTSFEVSRLPYEILSKVSVTKILKTDDGAIWIGTYEDGLFRIKDGKLRSFPRLSSRPVTALLPDSRNRLVVISEDSVYRHDAERDRFQPLKVIFPEELGHVIPLSLALDGSGMLILGTKDHGPFRIVQRIKNSETFHALAYSDDPSVASSSVYAFEVDKRDRLWIASDFGVLSLDAEGNLLSRFGVQDGLQGDDFNFGAHLRRVDGTILFGGPNGYNHFDPELVKTKSTELRLAIPLIKLGNGLELNHIDLSNLKELRLGSDSYSVAIGLGLNDYTNTSSNQYTHKLEGLDDTWSEATTNNTITYTNLEPGRYTFRARGANAAGVWSDNEVSLTIVVLPPWWGTWWAFGAYGLLAIFIFWMIMRTYRSHLLKEEALRIAQEMHDAADQAQDDLQESQEYQDELVRAVSQHNLATLDLISHCLEDSEGDRSCQNRILGHIKALELLEKCYFFQEGELVADMHTYVDGLTNYLLNQSTVDPATITSINRVTRETLPAKVASPLAVILYELLHNTMVHAFSPASSANFVEISMGVTREPGEDPHLVLMVADDGIGDEGTARDHEAASGLKVIRSLAAALGATFGASSDNGYTAQLRLVLPDQ